MGMKPRATVYKPYLSDQDKKDIIEGLSCYISEYDMGSHEDDVERFRRLRSALEMLEPS